MRCPHAFNTMEYISTAGKPAWTPITRVVEGGESTVFKSAFYMWDPPKVFDFSRRESVGVAKMPEQQAIDIAALQAGAAADESQQMVDDGSGKTEIWRIEDMAKVPVDEGQYLLRRGRRGSRDWRQPVTTYIPMW